MSPDDQLDVAPGLADAVRRAYVRPVGEAVATRQVSAIVAAAGAGAEPADRRPRGRVWRSALSLAAATLVLPAGLATAGVSLPDALERPYRAVGITLPHQSARPESPSSLPVVPARPPSAHKIDEPTRPTVPSTRRPAAGSEGRTDLADPPSEVHGSRDRAAPRSVGGAGGPGAASRRSSGSRRPATRQPSKGVKHGKPSASTSPRGSRTDRSRRHTTSGTRKPASDRRAQDTPSAQAPPAAAADRAPMPQSTSPMPKHRAAPSRSPRSARASRTVVSG